MAAVQELVGVCSVGTVVAVPIVFIRIAAEDDVSATITDNQFVFVTIFDALDDKLVVESIAVRGEDVRNLDFYGCTPIHLVRIHALDHRVFLLLVEYSGLLWKGDV